MKKKRVVVAMSGGVDSSVSAFLLKEQGYDVIGLFMKNWEEEEGGACTSQQDYEDVARVCQPLSIPFFSVNFSHFYKEKVFSDFLEKLQAGLTPNPDILCNREIKFKILLEQALKLGADLLATGHYAQTNEGKLLRGVDISKDQSYFLYTLKSSILSSVVFPIGHLTKTKVREIALQAGIATATKKDSTGICFIGNKDLRSFLCSYIPYQPGDIQDIVGKKVGTHRGVAYYTLGQRKGLEIGGAGEACNLAAQSQIDPAEADR